MKRTDFKDLSTGTLVDIEGGRIAFVPNPVPRQLDLDATTVALMAEAEHALGRLDGLALQVDNPYTVGAPLLRQEAIYSSRIEGTYTTPEQLVLFEAVGRIPEQLQATADAREVTNYIGSMNHGLKLLAKLPICLRLIKEVHKVLLQGVRGEKERPGEIRTDQNFIGQRGQGPDAARFVPPPVAQMSEGLTDFEKFINEPGGLPPLVKAALMHYQFEAIHPFRDGNGRVGRILVPLFLIQEKRIRTPVFYISAFFDRRRDDYYDLLFAVSSEGDYRPWVRFFLEGVKESAEDSALQATGLLDLRRQYHASVQGPRASALLPKLIDAVFRRLGITITQAAKLLSVTPASASASIYKLVERGILVETTGKKKNRLFIAQDLISLTQRAPRPQERAPKASREGQPAPTKRVRIERKPE